jgi:DNA repair exonuclease SbcCD ATPase subunit
MITLKKLKWDNLFSYSIKNEIILDKDLITQLVGKNGHGKSSIALILEEVLFNKNSKGIKKADILNRHIKDKLYSISLEFDKDGDIYEIETTRGSTQVVSLYRNKHNISAHTATATFKQIEEILGFDHKTFTQLVYQSSSASLEFLTATDTNRKKFLIDLLSLTKYTEAFEVFKGLSKKLSEDVLVVETKFSTTQSWLDKHAKEKLTIKEVRGIPVWENDPAPTIASLYQELSTLDATNKKISKNEIYKKQFLELDISDISKVVELRSDKGLVGELAVAKQDIKVAEAFISKVAKLNGTCPTCLQEVDAKKLEELIKEQDLIKTAASSKISEINIQITEIAAINREAERVSKIKSTWETLHSLIDHTLPTETLDVNAIDSRIFVLRDELERREEILEKAIKENTLVTAHNSKVKVIKEQIQQMSLEIKTYSEELKVLTKRLSLLQILQKTFSTNGLIAYKIECLVKDLEVLANEYLTEISAGRFQLTFKVTTGDKLNVIITDNGKDIEILALSGGERARVNTATLLAIRKLMQSLSNARINLLILDETVDSLDIDGKEKLIEILLKEEHLNTFLVSHGFTHPLLEKVTVVKENNLSRLE